jgi:hypothetical protein
MFSIGWRIYTCFLQVRVAATTRFSKLVHAYLCAGKNRRHFSLAQLSRIRSDPEFLDRPGPDLDHDQDLTFLIRKIYTNRFSYVVQFAFDNIHTKAGIKNQNLLIFIRGKVFLKGCQLY